MKQFNCRHSFPDRIIVPCFLNLHFSRYLVELSKGISTSNVTIKLMYKLKGFGFKFLLFSFAHVFCD